MDSSRRTTLAVWLSSLVVMLLGDAAATRLLPRRFAPLDLLVFSGRLVFIFLSVYFSALAIRWLFRKLFWRVGRRLALSYVLIGVLPFIFFAILMVVVGYVMAGVLSQTTLKMERGASLARLTQQNVEYALTNQRPAGALQSLEIYDSQGGSISQLPQWLSDRTFSGLVARKKQVLFVAAKIYDVDGEHRSVVLVQPIDREWTNALQDKNGMLVSTSIAVAKERRRPMSKGVDIEEFHLEGDSDFNSFMKSALGRNGVIWGDISPPLYSWDEGKPNQYLRMASVLSNPWLNLLDFYFGNSQYVRFSVLAVTVIASSLAIVYLLASLMAAALILSITRAVNRIDRGTKAVEKGDFSYRIAMRPTNQLGEVAQSFNRMTESIGSLLVKVAEKERLQSEIDIAASIQRNLLPRSGPDFEGVSFAAHFEPTAQIGGDYYDIFNIDQHRLAVAIGDVSGHGLSTGLVMAMVKAALSTLVEEGADEKRLFHRLNDLVLRSTDKRAFMTLGFTIFDLESRVIRHTNAGHLYPYIIRIDGSIEAIEAPSLPLGVRAETEAVTATAELRDGDAIVYLSDGIIEAQDAQGEPFGFDRLEQILAENPGRTSAEVQEAVLAALARHCGRRAADDDRTVMVVRFAKTAEGAGGSQPQPMLAGAV